MKPEIMSALITNLGFPVALAIFLLWWVKHLQKTADSRSDKIREEALEREKRLGARIDVLEDDHRKELVQVASQYSKLTTEAVEVLRRLCRSHDEVLDALEDCPCLVEKEVKLSRQSKDTATVKHHS